jgi:hypothetical protein
MATALAMNGLALEWDTLRTWVGLLATLTQVLLIALNISRQGLKEYAVEESPNIH